MIEVVLCLDPDISFQWSQNLDARGDFLAPRRTRCLFRSRPIGVSDKRQLAEVELLVDRQLSRNEFLGIHCGV